MFSSTPKFESLLEAVPDALVGMDGSGVIRFVNHQTESLFGYDRDDLVGQHVETLVPESLWHIYLSHREGYFADPRSRSMGLDLELRGRHSDGTRFPVNISLSRIDTGDVLVELRAANDQTRQKQAFQSVQRMRAIIEHSEDAIISETLGGTITTWNPAAERMFGYTGREIIGRPVDDLEPEARKGEVNAILSRVRAGQTVSHFETTRVRKDGTTIAVSISVSPIRDEAGLIVGASAINRDVTERVKAFEAARAMLESSHDSLVAISPEGRITDANQATTKVTGVAREKLIGTAFSDYFTDRDRANEMFHSVFAERAAEDFPLTIRHRDGSLTDVVYNASVHRGLADDVLGAFAAARDVTKLTRALEFTRAMIESSLDSMVAISPEGKITDVNETTITVTGVPRDQLIGTAFSDYFTEPEKANAIYQLVFEKGMAVDYPLTIRHRNGSLTEVRYNASVYRDSNGEVLGAFAAARDVTTQNQAQRKLAEQQARELDRLADLESFHRLTVGRELQMIELKKEIEYLRKFAPADRREDEDGS